jgi:two-component system, cell cycle sensor histidine kinase and response regulator CckA
MEHQEDCVINNVNGSQPKCHVGGFQAVEVGLRKKDGADVPIPEPKMNAGPGAETILIAEDEPGIRELISLTLQDDGYTVLEAPDGKEALVVFSQLPAGGKIDLLLTDLMMPHMRGDELATEVNRLFPETKILFCTAYPEGLPICSKMSQQGFPFLQKPVSMNALKRKVREVLGGVNERAGRAGA